MNNDGMDRSGPNWERQALEKLITAIIEEQKSARRWKAFWRLVLLFAVGGIVWFASLQAMTATPTTQPHTALIDIRGEIGAQGETDSVSIIDSLRAAFEDAGALAVVLSIDSPGGSPVQAGLINDEVNRLKALHKKPVYVVVGDTCASAAYYIAVAADEIYVDKASIVGSIGVLMDGFGFTGLMDKVGVERRLLTAGDNKGFLDPFSPQTEKQRAHALAMLSEIHQQFIAVVKNGRGNRLKETPEMFSGLFWSGAQSVEMGLADGLGSVDYVAREIVKAEEIVDYTRRDNVAERLAKRFGAAFASTAVQTLVSNQLAVR